MAHKNTGEIFPKGRIRQGKWFSLTLEEQEEFMKTKMSEQPYACWNVPIGGWKSNTEHLPEVLAPEILSPSEPRVSPRNRRSSPSSLNLTAAPAEYVTPSQVPKRRRSISKEVLCLISILLLLFDAEAIMSTLRSFFFLSRHRRFLRELVMEGSWLRMKGMRASDYLWNWTVVLLHVLRLPSSSPA